MHRPDPAGDSGSVRKMAALHRKGSNTSSGAGSVLSTAANPAVSNSHVSADDYHASLLIQPPASTSTPGHPPHHNLSLHSQPTQSAGAQTKKKSGFQITSVTPAQVSVSTNNSIAEDTESYDDLDESHTEDLSSSEILDVSLSRANDVVGGERSSSEETLNNFHEVETPGAVSPNQPAHPHALSQPQQHGGVIMNGTIHSQHVHQPNHSQNYPLSSVSSGGPSASRALPSLAQKKPSNTEIQENASHAAPASVTSQTVGISSSVSAPGVHGSSVGNTASIINPQTSSVGNVNTLSSATVPVRGGTSTSSINSGGGGFPLNVTNSCGGEGTSAPPVGNHMPAANLSMIQQHQNINPNITMATTTTTAAAAAVCASGGVGAPSGTQGRVGSAVLQAVSSSSAAVASAPVSSAPAPATATTGSRFRVVKLDSSSEPFKKGRWTCTEFYDKEGSVPASFTSASDAGNLSTRQFATEGFAGGSERESMSSTSVSTMSHYIESTESGVPQMTQLGQDFSSTPQGYRGIMPGGLDIGVLQTHPQIPTQDIPLSQVKTTVAPTAPTNIQQPTLIPGHPTTVGLPTPAVPQQQLTYAQAVASQPPAATQDLVGVQQQTIGFAALPQHSASPAPHGSVRPPEYTQPQQGLQQVSAAPSLVNQPLPGLPNGSGQMTAVNQPSQGQKNIQQTAPAQSTPSVPPHVSVASLGRPTQSHPSHLDCQQQKPQSLPTQIQNSGLNSQLPVGVHQSQATVHSAPSQSDHHAQAQVHSVANSSLMPPQGVSHNQPSSISLTQDHSSSQAISHAAQASALYASLPSFTTTQLQDAQRLLLQHQSALLGLPKLSTGEASAGASAGLGQDTEGNNPIASALTAPVGSKTDGEEDSTSGASVVAIDNKIEQAMDLVKSHLMYAVREEVEVLKEQIKELLERNSQLEQENTLLKTLASPEQIAQFQAQVQTGSPPAPPTTTPAGTSSTATLTQHASHSSGPSA